MIFQHTKVCSECHKAFPTTTDYFHKDKRVLDGLKAACKTCSNKRLEKLRKEHPEKIREYTQTYSSTHREELSRRSAEWIKDNPDKKAEQSKRYSNQNPEKRKAHAAVKYAVKTGRLPSPKTLDCVAKKERCKGEAREYHHHKGYSEKFILDVIPVCSVCHRALDKGGC